MLDGPTSLRSSHEPSARWLRWSVAAALAIALAVHQCDAMPRPLIPFADCVDALSGTKCAVLCAVQADGSWLIGPDPNGKNQRDHNQVCVTSMAVLALLPGLKTESLKIAQAVRRASEFLEGSQQAKGRFGPKEPMTMMYAHAYALRALCAVQREWPEEPRPRPFDQRPDEEEDADEEAYPGVEDEDGDEPAGHRDPLRDEAGGIPRLRGRSAQTERPIPA